MIDKITSIFDNYHGKITNPFIGTIISVWLIHNWRIPYALMTFDEKYTMEDKMNFISAHFAKQNFWHELCNIIGISFLILLSTFVLLFISRSITDFYYKILETYIITKIDSKAIFTQEDKKKLEERILELENLLNSKREEITRTESNYQVLTINKDKIQSEFNSYIENKTNEYNHLQNKMDELVKKYKIVEKFTSNYDDIIVTLTIEEKNALEFIISQNSNLYEMNVSSTLEKTFREHGLVKSTERDVKLNIFGSIFIEYYKGYISKVFK